MESKHTYEADEERQGNIWKISEINSGRYSFIQHSIEVILLNVLFTLCIILTVAVNIPLWLKVPIGVALILSMFNSFLVRSATFNKDGNTVSITRRLFGLWTVSLYKESLLSFNSVSIRILSSRSSLRLVVELVRLKGSTLRLKEFDALDNARILRDSIAEWLNIKVTFDPTNPNIR